jgi:hypothetical protein
VLTPERKLTTQGDFAHLWSLKMQFSNIYETEHISVLPGLLYKGVEYVGIFSSSGPLQFVWTMSVKQAREMGEHLIKLADEAAARAEVTV